MKFTKPFWFILAVMIVLFILPTILTYNAPFADGTRVYGFPLVFNAQGGFCYGSSCEHAFSYLNLVIDLLILVVVPLLVNYIILRIKNRSTAASVNN